MTSVMQQNPREFCRKQILQSLNTGLNAPFIPIFQTLQNQLKLELKTTIFLCIYFPFTCWLSGLRSSTPIACISGPLFTTSSLQHPDNVFLLTHTNPADIYSTEQHGIFSPDLKESRICLLLSNIKEHAVAGLTSAASLHQHLQHPHQGCLPRIQFLHSRRW